jgi:hypothetical protein
VSGACATGPSTGTDAAGAESLAPGRDADGGGVTPHVDGGEGV